MDSEFERKRRRLPQWRMRGAVYYVTWNKAGDREELSSAQKNIIKECLLHFNDERYRLYAYVVMNDHVHAIVQPLEDHRLSKILHTWKSFTAHRINNLTGRPGSLWQDESYSHILRDENELQQKAYYVITNPQRRWPELLDYMWVGWFAF